MSGVTKEEVKAFIEQIESDLANGRTAQVFELKLARIALASLTAEPVAWRYRLVDIDSGAADNWKYTTQCITPTAGKTCRIESVPLYARQATHPAPVVPDEWTIQDAVKFCGETGRQDAGSAMEAWDACRKAKLNRK